MIKLNRLAIAAHALVWMLLLVVPYVSTDQIFDALAPGSDRKYLRLCLTVSTALIGIFYINYLLLIPRYLLALKYWQYLAFLLVAIVAVFLLSGLLFLSSDVHNGTSGKTNEAIEKVFPVIIVNAIILWLLSIVSSVLWTVYNRLKQTESEKLSAQIASLKSQINPHFLFNTLNNISNGALGLFSAHTVQVQRTILP